MKKVTRLSFLALISLSLVIISSFRSVVAFDEFVKGAWHIKEGSKEIVVSFVDDYCVVASYDQQQKKFGYTWGGPYQMEGKNINVQVQFNTAAKDLVGTSFSIPFSSDGKKLMLTIENQKKTFDQVDRGSGRLAGVWRISGRKQGDNISDINLGARRTLKILTGHRFQWTAINIETKEFFGTGGGNYSFENGTYTERIEFFSRDSSRVGASLSFEGKIENGRWHHSGKSSKGEPIYEIWSRIKE